MTGPTVVVTAVGGGAVGEQILKALRLSDLGYHVVGTDMSPRSKGLYEVDEPYVVPDASDPRYVEVVLGLCEDHHAVALLCGSEPELKIWDRHRREVERLGVLLPVSTADVLDTCLDKLKTAERLAAQGFRVPKWRAVRELEDLAAFRALPAVLKPSRGGGGSANLYIAQTEDDLLTLGRYLLRLYEEFIVQEYVGTMSSEYTVGVLCSMDGAFLNSIALHRHLGPAISTRIRVPNQTGRAELGDTLAISTGFSQGDIGPFPEVTGPCEEIARTLGATGAINIQCRLVDGEVVVFEINPRFSGTTSLRAMVGYNEPDLLIRHHVLGQPVTPRFPYRSATILRGLEERLVTDVPVPIL